MKPKILLRIAALLMLLHTIGHTFGALGWKNAPNATIARVIREMIVNHFDFMGRSVTVASFFEGYGISLIGVLLLVTILLWFLSNDTENQFSIKYLAVLMLFLIFDGVVEYIYFFPLAAAFTLLAGICALFALINVNRNDKQVSLKNN